MPTSDCELIAHAFWGQPVNTVTTLAFLVAGVVVARRFALRWIGFALVATGIGSFLFHGPMPPGSQWAHDVSLAWLILVVAGLGQPWERFTRFPGLAVLGVTLALIPGVADLLAVLLVGVAIFVLLWRDRSPQSVAALAVLAVFAVIGRLGATGGPLCEPESLLQPHGLWHIGAAVVVAWWALTLPHTDTG